MIKTIKTKQFKILAALLALVLVVSCIAWNATKVHALEITGANTEGYTVVGGGTITDGKLTSASIGVYITNDSQDAKYSISNMKWTHDGTRWSSESKILYEGAYSTQKISAYYPYVANYTSGGISYSLTATQTEDTMKNDDLLYAAAKDLTAAQTDLTFKHLMSKLSVNVSGLGTEITEDPAPTVSKVEIGGLATAATFYPENGDFIVGSNLTGTTVAYAGGTTYDALVFPANYSTLTVTVTMSNGQVFTTTIACPAGGLAGGTAYTIELQVGQDAVVLGSIAADPWTPANGGDLATE